MGRFWHSARTAPLYFAVTSAADAYRSSRPSRVGGIPASSPTSPSTISLFRLSRFNRMFSSSRRADFVFSSSSWGNSFSTPTFLTHANGPRLGIEGLHCFTVPPPLAPPFSPALSGGAHPAVRPSGRTLFSGAAPGPQPAQ